MRQKLLIFFSIIVLASINYAIYEKEQLKANGETILLELAPRDPRSLMQGDYMRLRFALDRINVPKKFRNKNSKIYMVIKSDENQIAQFIRFQNNQKIVDGENLLIVRGKHGRIDIKPDSYFFQEGHASHYQDAKYGVFKFSSKDSKHEHMLIGLADEDRKLIVVD